MLFFTSRCTYSLIHNFSLGFSFVELSAGRIETEPATPIYGWRRLRCQADVGEIEKGGNLNTAANPFDRFDFRQGVSLK